MTMRRLAIAGTLGCVETGVEISSGRERFVATCVMVYPDFSKWIGTHLRNALSESDLHENLKIYEHQALRAEYEMAEKFLLLSILEGAGPQRRSCPFA
jgi:hypothetical protein